MNTIIESLLNRKTGSKSFDEWMQVFCKRKYQADFSLEMTRSVEEALKKFR